MWVYKCSGEALVDAISSIYTTYKYAHAMSLIAADLTVSQAEIIVDIIFRLHVERNKKLCR